MTLRALGLRQSENSEPIRCYEGLTLETSTLYCSYTDIAILVNSFETPNFCVSLPHWCRTTVSLEIKPFIDFQQHCFLDSALYVTGLLFWFFPCSERVFFYCEKPTFDFR